MSTLTQQVSDQISLTGGPSNDRLCDSYKYAYDKRTKVSVSFYDANGTEYRIQINQLAHEDGSGQSHIFKGNVVNPADYRRDLGFSPRYATGWFYAGSPRHGFIYMSDEPLPFGGPRR